MKGLSSQEWRLLEPCECRRGAAFKLRFDGGSVVEYSSWSKKRIDNLIVMLKGIVSLPLSSGPDNKLMPLTLSPHNFFVCDIGSTVRMLQWVVYGSSDGHGGVFLEDNKR